MDAKFDALTDTTDEVNQYVISRLALMTPEERFERFNNLYRTMRELALCGIKERHPGASERVLPVSFALAAQRN